MTDEATAARDARSDAILRNFESAKKDVSSAARKLEAATRALRELLAEEQRDSDDAAG